jgi:hypothetical protein
VTQLIAGMGKAAPEMIAQQLCKDGSGFRRSQCLSLTLSLQLPMASRLISGVGWLINAELLCLEDHLSLKITANVLVPKQWGSQGSHRSHCGGLWDMIKVDHTVLESSVSRKHSIPGNCAL